MRASSIFGLILIGHPSFADTVSLDGVWVFDEIRSTGISSDRAWERAQELIDQSVSIEEHTLFLPDDVKCSISEPNPETLQNDMRTFGSFGGNWQQIGLDGDNHRFDVLITDLMCNGTNERLFRIISQPSQNLHLADFGRVFSVMKHWETNP